MGRGEHDESSASYRTIPFHVDWLQSIKFKGVYVAAGGSHSLVYGMKE